MPSTTNFGWTTPADTDLVKDGAAAIRTLGNGVDASFVDLKGGTTGQVLSKNSNTDLDFTWVAPTAGDIEGVTAGTGISGGGTSGTVTITNSMATAIDAKGDLIVGTGADTFSRLAVGTNDYVLTAASGETTGLKWSAPSTGKIAQLITDNVTASTTSTTSTWTDSGLNITITPTNASSTLLFWWSSYCRKDSGDDANYIEIKLALTTGGDIQEYGGSFDESENSPFAAVLAGTAYTSAASTSSRTYRLYFRSRGGAGSSSIFAADGKGGNIFCMEVLP